MTAQPTLFDAPAARPVRTEADLSHHAARPTDPDTSHQAARRNHVVRGNDRHAALQALARQAMTDFELGDTIGRQQTSAGKRRGELRDLGLVEDSGERRVSPSGSNAVVWRITAAGFAHLEGLS